MPNLNNPNASSNSRSLQGNSLWARNQRNRQPQGLSSTAKTGSTLLKGYAPFESQRRFSGRTDPGGQVMAVKTDTGVARPNKPTKLDWKSEDPYSSVRGILAQKQDTTGWTVTPDAPSGNGTIRGKPSRPVGPPASNVSAGPRPDVTETSIAQNLSGGGARPSTRPAEQHPTGIKPSRPMQPLPPSMYGVAVGPGSPSGGGNQSRPMQQVRPRSDGATGDPSSNATVSGQLDQLHGKHSGLLQRARSFGIKNAASRGLANSSLAAGASQAAAYDQMLPIAQQDANAFGQFELADKGFLQNMGLNAQQGNISMALQQGQGQIQAALTSLQGGINSDLSQQEFEQALALAEQSGDVQSQLALLQGGIQAGLSNQTFGQQLGLAGQQANIQAGLAGQQFGFQTSLANQQAGIQSGLAGQQFGFQTALANQNANLASDASTQNFNQQFALNDQQSALAVYQQQQIANQEQQLAAVNQTNALQMEAIRNEHATTVQNSQNATGLYLQALTSMNQLYATPDLTPGQIANGAALIQAQLSEGLGLVGSFQETFGQLGLTQGDFTGVSESSGEVMEGESGDGSGQLNSVQQVQQQQYETDLNEYRDIQAQLAALPVSFSLAGRGERLALLAQLNELRPRIQAFDPEFTGADSWD